MRKKKNKEYDFFKDDEPYLGIRLASPLSLDDPTPMDDRRIFILTRGQFKRFFIIVFTIFLGLALLFFALGEWTIALIMIFWGLFLPIFTWWIGYQL